MIVWLHSTTKIVEVNGVRARIWEGLTGSGIPVHAYITRIAQAPLPGTEAVPNPEPKPD